MVDCRGKSLEFRECGNYASYTEDGEHSKKEASNIGNQALGVGTLAHRQGRMGYFKNSLQRKTRSSDGLARKKTALRK